jgi:hypothetical protein
MYCNVFQAMICLIRDDREWDRSRGKPTPVAKTDNKKRKRKNEDEEEEEAAFILDDLLSRERVLYLQEVPKVKASHCRAWNGMPRRRTREPITRSYYRFALKGGANLYGNGIDLDSS